jgi:hypothetical protein
MGISTDFVTPAGPLCVLLSDEAWPASDTSARNLQSRNEIHAIFPPPGRPGPLVAARVRPLVGVAWRVRAVVR